PVRGEHRPLGGIRRARPHGSGSDHDLGRCDDAVPVRVGVAEYGIRPVSPYRIPERCTLPPETDWRAVDLDQAVLIPPQRQRDIPTGGGTGEHFAGDRGFDSAIADRAAV